MSATMDVAGLASVGVSLISASNLAFFGSPAAIVAIAFFAFWIAASYAVLPVVMAFSASIFIVVRARSIDGQFGQRSSFVRSHKASVF